MPDRIIRESICTSDTLNQLSDFEERFWNRLIVNCDDYGRFDARPAILKGRLFPLLDGKTNKDMTNALSRLASVGLVELYQVDGKPFLRVVKWDKYQRIRAKRSKFPAPVDTCRQMTASDGKCPRNPIQSESNPNPNAETKSAQDLAVVVDAYKNKISSKPSQGSLEELTAYVDTLGAAVCLRAIDAALDAGKANWSYLRGILENKKAQGVRSLEDWDRLEQNRQRHGKGQQMPACDRYANDPIAAEDMARLRRMMEEMREKEA